MAANILFTPNAVCYRYAIIFDSPSWYYAIMNADVRISA